MEAGNSSVKTESSATAMAAPQALWMTPTAQTLRPRPATIHEGFTYCISSDFGNFTSWQSPTMAMQDTTMGDGMARPMSMHQDFYPSTVMESSEHWDQKPCNEGLDLLLGNDMGNIGQAYTADEAIPAMDLRCFGGGTAVDSDTLLAFDDDLNPRRLSGSSFTMSTSGGLSDMLSSYDDFSAALSDAPSFSSDYPPTSNRNSLLSSRPLSPVASPRMTPLGRSDFVRNTHSRGRASPSPRPGLRAAPYSVDGGPRSKRWSTGSYGTAPNRRLLPFVYHGLGVSAALEPAFGGGPPRLGIVPAHHPSPTAGPGKLPLNIGNLQQAAIAAAAAAAAAGQTTQNLYLAENPAAAASASALASASGYGRHSMLLPTQLPSSQTGSMAFHYPGFPAGSGLQQQQQLASAVAAQGLPQLQQQQHTVPSHLPLSHHHYAGLPQSLPPSSLPPPPPPPPPQPLLSQGLFRTLQSNGEPHSLSEHYAAAAGLSEKPDLYGSLREEEALSAPPAEDLSPAEAELEPHEQELRFRGDLYTPRWVRGHGNKREGWCGLCKPGRWLVLKNSAFWYDKSFTHGISAATGSPFQEPVETRRMDGNPDVWEGLCSRCSEWIPLVSSKKKGTTWFRHAYKCHAHPKVKDAPKRRRESSHSHNRLVGGTAAAANGGGGASSSGGGGGCPGSAAPRGTCEEAANKRQRSDYEAEEGQHSVEQQPCRQQQQQPQQQQPLATVYTPPPPQPPLQSTTPVPTPVATPTPSTTPRPSSLVGTERQQQQPSSSPSLPTEMTYTETYHHHQQPPFAHGPPAPVPPPSSYAPPPVPPRSHLRIQRQMARLEALKQEQQQQNRQSLPGPPPARQSQSRLPLGPTTSLMVVSSLSSMI